jgi:hypothetical protein
MIAFGFLASREQALKLSVKPFRFFLSHRVLPLYLPVAVPTHRHRMRGQPHLTVGDNDRTGQEARRRQRGADPDSTRILLGPIEPDDVVMTALYLASDVSRTVTGQILPVDSG